MSEEDKDKSSMKMKSKAGSGINTEEGSETGSIRSITDIRYLSPDDVFFSKTEGGFLSLLIPAKAGSKKDDSKTAIAADIPKGPEAGAEAGDESEEGTGSGKGSAAGAKEGGSGEAVTENSGSENEEAEGEEEASTDDAAGKKASDEESGDASDGKAEVGGKEEKYDRVGLHRAFPFIYEREYISVRTTEGKEIGMIRRLDDYPAEIIKIFLYELDRRYFTPFIQKINSIKEEFGYTYWDVLTDSGPRRFTVQNIHNNLVQINDVRILVLDVDGNRFEIPDSTKLDTKSLKMVERLL